jgi:hypothetical protein
MKTKILLWSFVLVLTVGMAGDTNLLPKADSPQVIHLDDHTKLTLLGTTFGHHHIAPGYENRTGIDTDTNQIVVWIKAEHEPSKRPSYELLVSDRANTGCVNIWGPQGPFVKDDVSLQSFVLSAFPRGDKETILRVKPYMGAPSKEQFVITNPVPGTVAHWTPEPLPATKSAGDLEVTLTKLIAGAPTPSWQGGILMPTNDPANQCVHLNFNFRENGQSTTHWDPWPVQTTDAVGNWSRGLIYAYPTNGVRRIWGRMKNGSYIPPPEHYGMDGYFYRPGLWPDESAWKVRLEFIRHSGFSDDEIVTFTNIPVKSGSQQDWDDEWSAWDIGKTNFSFTITPGTVNGAHLKLLPPLLVVNRWQSSQKDISIIIGAEPGFNPKDMNLTVVTATDDQGRELWSPGRSPWAGHYSIEFGNVHDDIKSLNLKLALHKSRFVEFTVKPTKQ